VVDRREGTDKKKNPSATRRLYHRFLYYKNFIALNKPLIITEGKTDTTYLKAAIAQLSAFHPKLGEIKDGKLKTTVKFMNYTKKIHDVLQLGGGTGDFKFFMLRHRDMVNGFKHRPLLFPIILLIDNDDGATEIFSVAGQMGIKISHKSTENFYRIFSNLYLVKSPETGKSKGKTCIEDLFDSSVLATEINGKKFDPDKKHGDDTKYGKLVFAENVIKPNAATIDFSNFSELLKRIVSVLEDYSANP
jgi:hypothetical protein